jgi:hypothetical protein
VEWDGLKVRILHVGRTAITLLSEHGKPIEICHTIGIPCSKKAAFARFVLP